MSRERFVGKRRPGVPTVPPKAGDPHPIRRAWGRPMLPPHWTPRLDADAAAERREAERFFAELQTGGYTIIW